MLQTPFAFLKRVPVRLLLAWGLLWLPGAHPCRAEGDTTGNTTPSAAHLVPVRLGSVDAVRGNLNLALPLGPRLPGRLPIGLIWHFDSLDPVQFRVGGAYRVAVWPVSGVPAPSTTVQIGNTKYSFNLHNSATTGIPTDAECLGHMNARGVDTGESEAAGYDQPSFVVVTKQPSSDGTKWYLKTKWNVSSWDKYGNPVTISVAWREVILDGPNAIWRAGGLTHFTNRWGDHVVAVETAGDSLHPISIRLSNQFVPSEWVQLDLTLAVATSVLGQSSFQVYQSPASLSDDNSLATLTISNGMGLPTVNMKGIYRTKTTTDGVVPGFIPKTWTAAANGESVMTQFTWGIEGSEEVPTTDQDPGGSGSTKIVPSPVALVGVITHASGMTEQFGYDNVSNLSARAFGSDGTWTGYHIGISGASSAFDEFPNPSSMSSVQSIITSDGGAGRSVLICRQNPTINKQAGASAYSWSKTAHVTWVLNYPTSSPQSSEPYRAVRLTHPSAGAFTYLDALGPTAYLFSTSAVLAVERIRGNGAPSNVLFPGSWVPSNPDADHVDQMALMDGWDLRSWANPIGSLAVAIPVTAVATRTRTYTANLPTKITVAGATRDTWGPIQTDEYMLPPGGALPTADGSNPGVWSGGLGSQSGNIQRKGLISRHWDRAALELVTDSDEKSLSGSDLYALRGVSSVNFGQSGYIHELGTALLTSTTGTRDGGVAQEVRTYVAGKPLVQSITKALSVNNAALPFSGSIGTTYGYDTTAHQWLVSETDKLTGRITSYQRDALGRITLTTDPNGVQIQTEYDGWGRVFRVTRLARGTTGQTATTYAYDPAGLWKTETVSADGRSLTTRTDFDRWGRITRVILPDGSTQRTWYDGWGQKTSQTPMLKPGQVPYGNFTWTYNDKGLLAAAFDPKGRRLSSTYDPSVGPNGLWEPQWVASENRVVTRTWDDRGYLRQEKSDLLGQKREVVDQAGQVSSYTYDQDGRLKHTDQNGKPRDYIYDSRTGWLTSRTEPEEGTTTYDDFTALGTARHSRMTGRSGQSNVETSILLDGWHRPMQIDVTNAGILATRRTFTYRNDFNVAAGLAEAQPNGSLSETYGYDDLARLTSKTVSDGIQTFGISRVLDASGNTVSTTYPSGAGRVSQAATTEYDALNRPWIVRFDNVVRGQMAYGSASGTGWSDTLIYGNGATTASRMDQGELVSVIHQVMSGLPGNQQRNWMSWTAGGLLLSRGPNAAPSDASNDQFGYDALQRLSHARTWGLNGELAEQWFNYDRWGNRIQSDYTYATNGGMAKPDELMAWRASYDGGNRLPLQVNGLVPGSTSGGSAQGSISGTLVTGAIYDDLGRMTGANAIPGNATSQTGWVYDSSGRITTETVNGVTTTFLLDGEGLRFKRMRPDGWLQYTVYGFNREPLSVFEKTPTVVLTTQATTQTQVMAASLTSAKDRTVSKGNKASPTLAPRGEPAGAYIDSPSGNTTVHVGEQIAFQGYSDFGTTYTWTFGDGTSASTALAYKTYANTGTFTATFKASASGYTTSQASVLITVVPALPVISSFTASPTTIAQGAGATLSWTVSGATSLSLGNGIGSVTGTTSLVVYPGVTTTYTLSATNGGGTVTRSVTVTVVQPPTITSFSANPASIYQGDGSTLNWTVSGATSLSLDNGIGAVSGSSRPVSPSGTTTYTLTATNTVNGVSVSRTASTMINVSPRPTVPSINSFTADAGAIAAGSGTTLRWSVSNSVGAVKVSISNVGSVAQSGTQWVTPASTLTYTLTATNTLDASKWVSRDVAVTVVNRPAISFSANPGIINVGSSSTLNWSVSNSPTSISIDQGIGSVGASGNRVVTPGATVMYTLTASNLAGTTTATATVGVTQKPVIVSFSAASGQINQGTSTTLRWSTQGATSLALNGAAVTGTSLLVSPTTTTTYTLVAANSAGTASASTTVTVVIPETYVWKKTLIYGFGILIAEEKPTGTFFVQGDQVGSPNIVTDAMGAVVGRSKNLPFGERFGQSGEKAHRRFTNHEDQDGSGIYMQTRTYLPAYGKFAQVDPAYDQTKDDPETWNLYNYVTNNPVTHTDPDGREASLGTMGGSFTDWFWGAVDEDDAMVAESTKPKTTTQSIEPSDGEKKDTKPEEKKAPSVNPAQTNPETFISRRVIATTLTITDGGSGDYNATYTLTQTISTMSQIPGTNDRIESLSTNVLATGDIRTVPDNPSNGSPTLNGNYSWVNHAHKGGFLTVQVRNPDGSGTLPTTGLNPNTGTFRQDGINVHPPMPNSSRVWQEPSVSLGSAAPRSSPFSMGCWQPRPDASGKALIVGLRNAQGSRVIRLNTSWNEGRTFD